MKLIAEALEALRLAVAILTEMGKFTAAAKNQKAMAEIYEKDIVDYEAAMDAYDRAGEWYSGEDSNAYFRINQDKQMNVSSKSLNLQRHWNNTIVQSIFTNQLQRNHSLII